MVLKSNFGHREKKLSYEILTPDLFQSKSPFMRAFLKRRVTCRCVTYKQGIFRTWDSGFGNFARFGL